MHAAFVGDEIWAFMLESTRKVLYNTNNTVGLATTILVRYDTITNISI